MGFSRTGVVYPRGNLAIRRDVRLMERTKAALPVRKQTVNARSGGTTDSGGSKRRLEAKRLRDIPEGVVL